MSANSAIWRTRRDTKGQPERCPDCKGQLVYNGRPAEPECVRVCACRARHTPWPPGIDRRPAT